MLNNIILDTDSYKFSHFLQYPQDGDKKTRYMFSYIESRGGKYGGTFFFGLQYILKRYFCERVTMEMVDEAAQFAAAHGEPFPYDGWAYIVKKLDGRLPLRIFAVPEGSWIPEHNILIGVESTDEEVPWIPGWMETQLMRVWSPITVATRGLEVKKMIHSHLKRTTDPKDWNLNFRYHDFGSRGVTCREQAGINGLAHLANWMGTDTCEACQFAKEFYYETGMAGFSIPAAEHSTITSWGKENEFKAYENMVNKFAAPGKIFACVSDSYNIFNAVENLWLKGGLIKRVKEAGATVVIRPDSGEINEVNIRLLRTLLKDDMVARDSSCYCGYTLLPPYVRIIQGDGVNYDSIDNLLTYLESNRLSAANMTFGSGGDNLQNVNRDTLKMAMKNSLIKYGTEKETEDRLVFKQPVTDAGKTSKAGRLDLVEDPFGKLTTIRCNEWLGPESFLDIVYENGELVKTYTLQEIRNKSNALVLGNG